MKYTVVIRARNEEAMLGSLLKDLNTQTLPPVEIVLVDSGSTDRTVAIGREFGCNVLSVEPQQFTYGRSLNMGFNAATQDVVVSLSAHVRLLSSDHIEKLTAPLVDPSVVATYGRQVPPATASVSEQHVLETWFPAFHPNSVNVPFLNNANAAYRHSAWREFPFDEDLPGMEDVHFAARASSAGYAITYVPEAQIEHHHEESWNQTRRRYLREARTLELVQAGSGVTLTSALGLALRNTVHDARTVLRGRGSVGDLGRVVSFRTAQFVGAWQGGRGTRQDGAPLRERVYGTPARRDVRNDT